MDESNLRRCSFFSVWLCTRSRLRLCSSRSTVLLVRNSGNRSCSTFFSPSTSHRIKAMLIPLQLLLLLPPFLACKKERWLTVRWCCSSELLLLLLLPTRNVRNAKVLCELFAFARNWTWQLAISSTCSIVWGGCERRQIKVLAENNVISGDWKEKSRASGD